MKTKDGNRCGSKTMLKREFDVVIIDEATQALEGNHGYDNLCMPSLNLVYMYSWMLDRTLKRQKGHFGKYTCMHVYECTMY